MKQVGQNNYNYGKERAAVREIVKPSRGFISKRDSDRNTANQNIQF
jgi:hypothetical protein